MYHKNPYFNEEKAAYLTLNDYVEKTSAHVPAVHFYGSGEKIRVTVCGNQVDVFDNVNGFYQLKHSFFGVDALDIFSFMLLMHITGSVPLQQFAANVRQANAENEIIASPVQTTHAVQTGHALSLQR